MCAHEIFEELSWNYADSGIGERGDGESVCRWRGISNEITGMQETHDLIAAVSGAGADLEHSCYDVRADQSLFAGPADNLVARDLAFPGDQSEPRSEERRVGKGCGSTCRSRWSDIHK